MDLKTYLDYYKQVSLIFFWIGAMFKVLLVFFTEDMAQYDNAQDLPQHP